MQHGSGFIGKIWSGSAAKKRNFILCVALVLVILLFIASGLETTNNKPASTPSPTVQNCNLDFKLGTGPVTDEFMESSRSECTEILEEDHDSLSITKKCTPDPLNFFLLWSTRREDFKLKHFRVIDSIFKYHPTAKVHIFTKEMSANDFAFYTEQSFQVLHHKLEPEKIFKDTPLARWANNITEWKKSSNYFSHVTDAMRLALLWKYGGVYLDTDAIVIRNVDHVRNALCVQHPTEIGKGEINGAVLMFDKRHPFLYFAMHLLVSIYDPNLWDIAGPQVVTKAATKWSMLHPYMVRWIPKHKAGELDLPNEPIGTAEVTVFTDRYAFYGLAWWQTPRIDSTPSHPDVEKFKSDIDERAYAYHYVNQMLSGSGGKIKKGVFLYDLLQRACLFECSYEDLEISITEVMDNPTD